MPDFRSNAERAQDEWREQRVEQDYKAAFEEARLEIGGLKSRLDDLEVKNATLQRQLSELMASQAENFQAVRSQVEAGLTKLSDDNRQLHTMIQSAQAQDLELVQQMDQNHRERLESLVRLFDQKGLPSG